MVLVKRTASFFRWMVAIARKRTGDNSMSASNIAMLFWIKQTRKGEEAAEVDTVGA